VVVHNEAVSRYVGKRVGPASTPTGPSRGHLLLLCAGVTASLVAWGLLVLFAIDLGGRARTGDSGTWLLVGLTSLGAVACLFVTLVLGGRVVSLLSPSRELPPPPPTPPRVAGGRRAAR
jgi:hypothetical protein